MFEDAAVTTVPIDTPASEISQEQLNALPMKDYIEIQNEREFEKKHPEPDEDADGTDPQRAKRGTSNKLQKRFDKLTRRAREAESRAQAAERHAAEVEAKIAGNGAAQPDFTETLRTQDEIIRSQHKLLRVKEESRRVDQEKLQSLQTRSKAAIAAMPDAEAIRTGLQRGDGMHPEVNHAVMSAIAEEANGVDIVAYLGRHPEEIAALHTLSPSVAAARIGKISNQLEANTRASREKPRPPAPISTVGGGATLSSVPLDQADMKTFMKVRNAQERARRI